MTSLRSTHLVLFMTRGMSLAAWDASGSFDREVQLYRELRPQVGRLTLVTYGDRRDLDYRKRLDGIKVVCNRLGLTNAWYERFLVHGWARTLRRPTIVKTNQMPGARLALDVARAAGARFVARCGYLHSFVVEQRNDPESATAKRAREEEQAAFAGADRAVVTTQQIRAMVIERYRLDPAKVDVIPNYVDTTQFAPRPVSGTGERRIIYVGRLGVEKNLLTLVTALAGLPGLELAIAGAGDQKEEVIRAAAELNLPLTLLGSVPHKKLPEMINGGAIFVLPSHYEGHPKALIEAMACGRAVVGTNVPGIRDVIRHEENGLLCPTDAAGLRAAVTRLLNDAPLRERLGHQARQDVLAHYALDRIVSRESELYEELLQAGKGK
ncbi:glycosyltransferase family 4 protein [Rhodospirillaceae bacterium SYSU D60014]|uniref:glycosyltransferase family 4 protein n=1 Tax=Virgifigura deserti TaxID=2268457 RepID=UPI000E66E12B